MLEKASNQMLKTLEEGPSGSLWVTRYLQDELEKGVKNPARASKWFRDKKGWIEEKKNRQREGTEYLSTRVPEQLLMALKKYTADHNLTMRAFICGVLEKALKERGALKEFSLN